MSRRVAPATSGASTTVSTTIRSLSSDNVFEAKAAGVAPDTKGSDAVPNNPDYPNVKIPAALNFTLKDIDGKTGQAGPLSGQRHSGGQCGSKCGNTPQYKSLEAMYEKYKSKGLVILGFPANDFLKQEPGTDQEDQGLLQKHL